MSKKYTLMSTQNENLKTTNCNGACKASVRAEVLEEKIKIDRKNNDSEMQKIKTENKQAITILESENENLKIEVKELHENNKEKEFLLKKQGSDMENLKKEKDTLKKHADDLQKQIFLLEEERNQLSKEKQRQQEEKQSLEKRINELKEELDSARAEIQEQEKKINELKEEMDSVRAERREQESKLLDHMKAMGTAMEKKMEKLHQDAKSREDERDRQHALQAEKSRRELLEALNKIQKCNMDIGEKVEKALGPQGKEGFTIRNAQNVQLQTGNTYFPKYSYMSNTRRNPTILYKRKVTFQ